MSDVASKMYRNVVNAALCRVFRATCVAIAVLGGATGCTSILGDDFRVSLFPDSGGQIPVPDAGDASIGADARVDASDGATRADGADASVRSDADVSIDAWGKHVH